MVTESQAHHRPISPETSGEPRSPVRISSGPRADRERKAGRDRHDAKSFRCHGVPPKRSATLCAGMTRLGKLHLPQHSAAHWAVRIAERLQELEMIVSLADDQLGGLAG